MVLTIKDKGLREIKEKSAYLKRCSEDEAFRQGEVRKMQKEHLTKEELDELDL